MSKQKPVAFTRCDNGADAQQDVTPTMRCGSNHSAHIAAAIPINGMTLNKELRDKQMTGIGGGRRSDVFREVKRPATRCCYEGVWSRLLDGGCPCRNIESRRRKQAKQTKQRSKRAINGCPPTNPARVRAVAGISRQSHAHPVARQVAGGLPGWAALQGAGQQHGRAVHGVDRQAHCRAAQGQAALPLRMQRDRSGLGRMGAAGLGASGLCRGGEVSQRGLGASLAAGAELGGHDAP